MSEIRDLCQTLVDECVKEGITRHVSYLDDQDKIDPVTKGLLVPKVTVEWVKEEETFYKPAPAEIVEEVPV